MQVVKYLVEECGSLVLAKTQSGQTPYDVASTQAVRGYLLPKQLQAETVIMEEESKAMGNHVTQIAPPPTMMMMMTPGHMQQQQQGGGGLSAVDMLMQPTSGVIPTTTTTAHVTPQKTPSFMGMNNNNSNVAMMPPTQCTATSATA